MHRGLIVFGASGSGTTTIGKELAKIMGFKHFVLSCFAKANDGAIRICSGKILYKYNKKDGAKYLELEVPFEGTLYDMDIIADNNHKYILK